MKELTLEITDYCNEDCSYCSSASRTEGVTLLPVNKVRQILSVEQFDRINISGGEPLSHPNIYLILKMCNEHVKKVHGIVYVYTNMIMGIAYNPNVRESVRVIANITVTDDTDEVHILKRIRQGREDRPVLTKSSNFSDPHKCIKCTHTVIRPDGTECKPCNKYPGGKTTDK